MGVLWLDRERRIRRNVLLLRKKVNEGEKKCLSIQAYITKIVQGFISAKSVARAFKKEKRFSKDSLTIGDRLIQSATTA